MAFNYPFTRRDDLVEDIHGQPIADPYRWLEDDHSAETAAWVAAQNELTFSFLKEIPAREQFRQRLTELWDYEKYGMPFKKGGRYFYTHNDGLQNQYVLFWLDRLDGEPRLLLDPNLLSQDGTVALSGMAISPDGKLLAYSLSEAGSDWQEWHVRSVDSGEDYPDRIQWSKFSGATWSKDSQGFYYSRYDAPASGETYKEANYFQKVYYHCVGTPQAEDVLVFERPDQKEWGCNAAESEDGRYLIIHIWLGTFQENALFYKELGSQAPVVELFHDFDASYEFLGNDGSTFYLRTNRGAPRYRVVAVDTAHPQPEHWRDLAPETGDTIEYAHITGDRLFVISMHDASHQVNVFNLEGASLGQVTLPGIGSVDGFSGTRDDRETFYIYSSFTTPGTVYHYSLDSAASEVFRQPALKFNPEEYSTEQVFYSGLDGTRVPMFIVARKGMARNSENRTYLYGYGGFNISLTPAFSPNVMAWLESGGVFAQPNLRGGGEYGKVWHDGGKQHNKRNVFNDFIVAAEWLISNGYTKTSKLAIHGRSNGGLLTGACLTQRPDLYGAVIVTVGVLDMLRFHKWTIGWAWVSDYGSPDDPADAQYLLTYSPYHNLKPGAHYPPTLVTTGDHDDRVFPAHSFKFAAALQAAQAGPAPTLIRIDVRAGHGAGKPTAMVIAEMSDIFAFIWKALH